MISTLLRRGLCCTLALASLMAGASALAASSPATDSKSAPHSTHQTALTRFVEVDGARLAYRRFGTPNTSGIPLVLFQHFVGNLDSWDPKVIDGLASHREVILFDNAGVASSTGAVPNNIEGMANYAIDMLKALGVSKADLLGFSMGSFVAQEVAIERPDLVRSLILVGSSPRGGIGMATLTPEFQAALGKKHDVADELLLDVFFTPSAASQAAGRDFLTRLRARKINRDSEINETVAPNQVAAIAGWGAPHDNANAYLNAIKQPALVVAGSHDIVFYTVNDFTLQQNLPNAQLSIYPDANHGAIYQYPDLFLKQAELFLSSVK